MSIPTQPFDKDSFSGGISDFPKSAAPTQCEAIENFLVQEDGTLLSRPGSELFDSDHLTAVKPSGMIHDLINFGRDAFLLVRSGNRVFVKPATTWLEVRGPGTRSVLPTGALTERSIATACEHQDHLYVQAHDPDPDNSGATDDPAFESLMKIYRDGQGTFRVQNASLPKFPDGLSEQERSDLLYAAAGVANSIRASLAAHFADTVAHFRAQLYTFAPVVDGLAEFELAEKQLVTLTTNLLAAYEAHIRDARTPDVSTNGKTYHWSIHTAAGYGDSFGHFFIPPYAPPSSLLECIPLLNHLRRHINFHYEAFVIANPSKSAHGGGVSVVEVPASDIVIQPKPEFANDGVDSTVGIPTSERVRFMSTVMNTHFLRTGVDPDAPPNQYEAHPGGSDSANTIPTNDLLFVSRGLRHTTLFRFYRMLIGFMNHRVSSKHVGGSTEPTTTAVPYAATLTHKENSGALYAIDLSTPTGWEELSAQMELLKNSFNAHTGLATAPNNRHSAGNNPATGGNKLSWYSKLEYGSFIYAFNFKHSHKTVTGVTYEDRGTPAFFRASPIVTAMEFSGGDVFDPYVKITKIPQLANLENLPHMDTVVEIYRTTKNGTVLYKIGEVPAGTQTFVDKFKDTLIQTQPPLYTTGGVLAFDPAPKSKVFAVVNETGYFGGCVEIEDGSEVFLPTRLRQSVPGIVHACPEAFYYDFSTPVKTIGAAGTVPVVVCSRGVYRIDGAFDELGRGGMFPVVISQSVGGVSPNGGATLDDIFYFLGADGVYMTNGFKVEPIARHLPRTLQAYVSDEKKARTIKAVADTANRRIHWTVTEGSGNTDTLFVLDLNQPILSGMASFVKLTGGESFRPTALCFFGGEMIRGDEDGFLFRHRDGLTSDLKIDRDTGELTGDRVHVPWLVRDAAQTFGTAAMRKWVPEVSLRLDSPGDGNLSVQPRSINDLKTDAPRAMNPVRHRNGNLAVAPMNRKFPAGHMRATYKQLELAPASVILAASGNADVQTLVSVGGSVATLDTSPYTWPQDCEDWFLSFETDGYTAQYRVLDRVSDDTLLLESAPAGVTGSVHWQLKGVPKDERCHVLGFTYWAAPLSSRQIPSDGVSGGNT